MPNSFSEGCSAFSSGPASPARNALANILGSEIPEIYRASADAADALSHDCATASAWSFVDFGAGFLVAIMTPLVVIFF